MRTLSTLLFILLFAMTGIAQTEQDCRDALSDEVAAEPEIESFIRLILNDWNIPEQSLSAELVRLVYHSKLVSQFHESFQEKGLLPEGGGLCNSTCAAAIAIAHSASSPLTQKSFDSHLNLIPRVVDSLSLHEGRDARMGSSIPSGTKLLKRMIQEGLLPDSLYMDFRRKITNELHLSIPSGAISYMSVGSPYYPHAVIILAINPEHRNALIYNPHFSDELKVYRIHSYSNSSRGIAEYSLHADDNSGTLGLIMYGIMINRGETRSYSPDVHEKLRR